MTSYEIAKLYVNNLTMIGLSTFSQSTSYLKTARCRLDKPY